MKAKPERLHPYGTPSAYEEHLEKMKERYLARRARAKEVRESVRRIIEERDEKEKPIS
jgi:hypothetical protein